MRIAMIGGVERNERALEEIASSLGHELDYHGGHMKGRGVDEMWKLVRRCDLLIVSTDVNSHTAVMVARKVARLEGKEVMLTRSGSPSKFREMLRALPKAA
jgi:hypothetical protein